ncbi:MAG: helix-turn-helix domain-containing protein [Steroidobacteraceae bacterium]
MRMGSVFLLREMPDWERLKPSPENEAYRRWFYGHWGWENSVISGTDRNVEYMPWKQRLSIKVARGGRERYFIDGRSIAVDDDCYLILNDNRVYASRFESNVEIDSFSIFFRPGLAEEVYGALGKTVERALADGGAEAPRPVEFAETLQPHDAVVTPVLRYVQYGVNAGVEDADWYEEQFQFLLERMLAHHRRLTERILELPALKSATQREIHRRLARAVDLVHSSYDRGIGLAEMAGAACLSKFHFLRLFTELHGITPHAYLQRKRAHAAGRLLETTDLPASQVAARVGFNSRSTMARQLRRWNLD